MRRSLLRLKFCCEQASIAARVRQLEIAIPGLREKLAPGLDLRLEKGSFSRSTGHNILGRVEMLEDALELLLTAQVLTNLLKACITHPTHSIRQKVTC